MPSISSIKKNILQLFGLLIRGKHRSQTKREKMDLLNDLAQKASNLSDEQKASYLAWGMIANGLFVAPILTFILPAYYGKVV